MVNSRDGRQISYHVKKERAEMMEWVSKAVSSFSCALKAVTGIMKFQAVSLTTRHVA